MINAARDCGKTDRRKNGTYCRISNTARRREKGFPTGERQQKGATWTFAKSVFAESKPLPLAGACRGWKKKEKTSGVSSEEVQKRYWRKKKMSFEGRGIRIRRRKKDKGSRFHSMGHATEKFSELLRTTSIKRRFERKRRSPCLLWKKSNTIKCNRGGGRDAAREWAPCVSRGGDAEAG